ncbi:MAG: heme lyase CcmF/NrfE family subunit [bacterium]|nr:heme lyase CcmF/NrfE family subunit [bacterium]
MAANFGNISLSVAFAFALYAVFALLLGTKVKRRDLIKSGENAVYAYFTFVTLSMFSLIHLLVSGNFQIEYVASVTNESMPIYYKIAALWGGQAGSLLFWTWIVSLYTAIVAYRNRHTRSDLVPTALGIMSLTALFFLVLNRFSESPFNELAIVHAGSAGPVPFAPQDGNGLNPLLQHPVMVIHPPILYLGYVGMVVPFSFAVAALITKQLSNAWITLVRRWTLIAWGLLGAGIILGGKWAYMELGWGGYWAWDPVENASLMPWLTATAFLHSVIVQEKKNMLRVWNMVLIISTYLLVIFGTFLTRSGIVSSVHAFAQSSIGIFFVSYIAITGAACLFLIFSRLEYLKSDSELDSIVSRESSFLFNNLVFLAACFAVLWGTIFPVISEAIQGEQITVGAPFFNKINIPIGLFILFLTGVGPLLAWRKTSVRSLNKNFFWPLVVALVAGVLLFLAGVRGFYALLSLYLCIFVGLTITSEFARGVRARMRAHGEQFHRAFTQLINKNKRRYGGYIVHFGVILIFLGFTGNAFNKETQGRIKAGESMTIGSYTLHCDNIEEGEDANFSYLIATITVSKGGKTLQVLRPEKRFYFASEQGTSEVALRSNLVEDLYVVFAGVSDDERAVIQVFLNPLVVWVWIGTIVMVLGTIITILPNPREVRLRRRIRNLETLLTAKGKI